MPSPPVRARTPHPPLNLPPFSLSFSFFLYPPLSPLTSVQITSTALLPVGRVRMCVPPFQGQGSSVHPPLTLPPPSPPPTTPPPRARLAAPSSPPARHNVPPPTSRPPPGLLHLRRAPRNLQPGYPRRAPRAARAQARFPRHVDVREAVHEGRVSQGHNHAPEEAQLGRSQNRARALEQR